MGHCKDCKNGEDFKGKIYCNHYKGAYDAFDSCDKFFISKTGSSSSGCFITTACVQTMGLPDDCYELSMFRTFRDEYLLKRPDGIRDVNTYYRVAPQIVDAINMDVDSIVWYNDIYCNLVMPILDFLEKQNFEGAWSLYKEYVKELAEQFNVSFE